MTWEPTFDSGFPSQLFVRLATFAKAWVLSAASCIADAPRPPRPPPKPPILNDAFSKPHICDCLYCAFPRNHLGGSRGVQPCGGRGARFARSHQSLSDARHFPIDLFNTPPSSNSQIQEPKHFPQIANATDDTFLYIWTDKIWARHSRLPKKSISSHKLFIILVTSTIHYANDNNCKGISQDRMHEHHVLKTAKIPICQICFVEGIYTKHFFIEVFCTISISMVFWFHQHQTSIFDERHTSDFNNLALSLKSIAFCQLKAAWTE